MATSTRYFDLVREMKNPYNHRLRLVESVRERGIKPTARLFATSALTVRHCYLEEVLLLAPRTDTRHTVFRVTSNKPLTGVRLRHR